MQSPNPVGEAAPGRNPEQKAQRQTTQQTTARTTSAKARTRTRETAEIRKRRPAPVPPLPDGLRERIKAADGRLPMELRRFMAECNGARMTPAQVRKYVLDFCGVEVSLQAIEYYDPTKKAGKRGLSPALREVFWQARNEYDRSMSRANLASPAYRVHALDAVLNEAMRRGDLKTALSAIELAIKIDGGMLSPAAQDPRTSPYTELAANLTHQQRIAALQRLFRAAHERMSRELGEVPMTPSPEQPPSHDDPNSQPLT